MNYSHRPRMINMYLLKKGIPIMQGKATQTDYLFLFSLTNIYTKTHLI